MSEPRARVAIIDYELANMFSVDRACSHVGLEPVVTSDPRVIESADAAILPGVGAFGEAMHNLHRLDLVEPIRAFIDSGKPFLGICLGMQLLFTGSEEFGETKGLGIIAGRVVRFPGEIGGRKIRVPHIGWNRVVRPSGRSWEETALSETASGEYMYFLHSFYVVPDTPGEALCVTNYEGIEYCSGVARENVSGLQFHPEKSAERGIDIYRSFASQITAGDPKPS